MGYFRIYGGIYLWHKGKIRSPQIYQQGADLYWKNEEELAWKYKKEGMVKGLRGIPDISIRYSAKKDALVMIDIKNRVLTAGSNSEEIYKMIGYFANFKTALEEYLQVLVWSQQSTRNSLKCFVNMCWIPRCSTVHLA